MTQANHQADPDDLFADTRMTFGEHIEELRWHLWRAILGFLIALVASFFISKPVPQEKSEQVSVEIDADALMNAVNLRLSRTLPAPMEPMMALLPSNESITQSGGVQ